MIWCVCSPTSTPPDLKKGSTGVKSNSLRENGSSLRKMAKVRFGWPTHWYLGVMQWKLKYQSLQSISKTVTPCGSSFNGLRPSRRDWRKKRPGLFLIFHEVYIYIYHLNTKVLDVLWNSPSTCQPPQVMAIMQSQLQIS